MSRELTFPERYYICRDYDLNEWLTIHYEKPKTMEYMDKHNIPKTLEECNPDQLSILDKITDEKLIDDAFNDYANKQWLNIKKPKQR